MIRLMKDLEEVEMYLTAPLYIYGEIKHKLSLFDRLLFTSIYGMAKNTGKTRATDNYFMQLLGKSDKTIAKSMKRLDDAGLIERQPIFNPKTGKRNRTIRLIKRSKEVIHAPMEIYLLDITDGAKMLLVQLVGLSQQEGYVYATNKVLAEKMDVSKRMLRRYLSELTSYGLITVEKAGSPQRIMFVDEGLAMGELMLDQGERLTDYIHEWKVHINNYHGIGYQDINEK